MVQARRDDPRRMILLEPDARVRADGLARAWEFWLYVSHVRQPRTKALTPVPPASESLGDALEFMQVLWALAHGLESSSKRMHAELGVTGPQRLVLRIVGHHRRIAAGQLAEVLHIHPSSLTGILKRLEDAELLRRESDPFDRRRALLALTKRGQRLNDRQDGTIESVVAEALAKVPKQQVSVTKAVLGSLAAVLQTAAARTGAQ